MNYFNNDLDITIAIIVISLLLIIIYDLIRNHGKFYLNILRPKTTVQNKNAWSGTTNINEDTKGIDFDFKLQLYNHKKYYTSIYNMEIKRKNKRKLIQLDNPYLNLVDTAKMVTGAVNYEKFRYATLLPFEIREFQVKIKINKEEIDNIKKQPIYLIYKVGRKTKKIKLNKYLKEKKKNK